MPRAKRETEKAAEAIAKILANIDVDETELAEYMVWLHGQKLDRWHRIVLDYIVGMANTPHPQKVQKTIACQRMLDSLYKE